MIDYLVYDVITGRILKCGSCPESMLYLQAHEGLEIKTGHADNSKQYVLDGKVVNKPNFPVSIDKTTVVPGELVTINNVPIGTKAFVDGEMFTVDDGSLSLTFDIEGEYKILMDCFPYLPYEGTIICK